MLRRDFLKTTAAAGLLTAVPAVGRAQPSPGIVGQFAPELEVRHWINSDGEPGHFSIKESAGKWTLLKCFQNWCPGCHEMGFPMLKEFSERFHDHPKVAIAAIQTVFEGYNVNTQDAVRELQLRYELPIMMGHDPGGARTHASPSTMRNYRTGGTPWLILINPQGIVVFNDYHVHTKKFIEAVEEAVA